MSEFELPEDIVAEFRPPGAEITRDLFMEWRSPRPGSANPERMNNPVWEWLIRTRVDAFQAGDWFKSESACELGPGWCFSRFGQSRTILPDGRIILIAGEHEDYYDSDFYIYNDVVVKHPDGRVDIYCYPREIFPPTDSHSATLVGNRILIIGCIGYPEQRRPETTPVFELDLGTFAISSVATTGPNPGWVYKHTATISEDATSILLAGGNVERGKRVNFMVENIDDWRLHLLEMRWERLTDRQWPRWEVRRQDCKPNHLWEYSNANWREIFPKLLGADEDGDIPTIEQYLGRKPDLAAFRRLYVPSTQHESVPNVEDEYRIFRVRIDGVTVRFVEDSHGIQMTVEGQLPAPVLDTLSREICEKLAYLENVPCELVRI